MALYLGSNIVNKLDVVKKVTFENISLEDKTVSPQEANKIYMPDSGYDAFSQFTVNGAPLQSKSVQPTESIQVITADSSNYGLKQVSVGAMKLGNKTIIENGIYVASSESLDGYKQVTVNVPNKGIEPIIANEDNIVPSGTYATDTYYNKTYGVKIGYMSNGDVMISMMNGTSTAYENLYFYAASLPDGATLEAPSTFGTGNVVGMTFVGIIHGLTGSANITIDMSTRNSSQDYVRCDLTIAYI